MAVIETVSAILTISSLIATIYFKRHQARRFIRRQYYLLKRKYRQYRDRRATAKNSVSYMPVKELETIGLKHADNLEELENEIFEEQFPSIDIIDLQADNIGIQSASTNSDILTNSSTSFETTNDAQSFITAKEMPMNISNEY